MDIRGSVFIWLALTIAILKNDIQLNKGWYLCLRYEVLRNNMTLCGARYYFQSTILIPMIWYFSKWC